MSGEFKLGKGNSVEDALIRLSVEGLSAEEISARIGGIMTPERVKLKIEELLQAPNWLTVAQQDQALLLLARKRLSSLQDAFIEDGDRAKIELAYIKQIFERLDKRQAATEHELNTYDQNVGRQLGHIVDLALTYMKGALREDVDPDRWDALVQEALVLAWTEIEKKQVEPA